MIQKIHTLQRRLIQKTEEVISHTYLKGVALMTLLFLPGGRKGAPDPREGEAIHGTKGDSEEAAWARGG